MSDRPTVVVLTGRKFSGKDTMVKSILPFGFTRLSFSDQLKRICVNLFPWMDFDYPQGDKDRKQFSNNTLSPRDIWLKMNVVTEIDRNILVSSLVEEMELDHRGKKLFVISDLRKPEEYEWVKMNGYPIIKIVEPNRNVKTEDELENFIDSIVPDHVVCNYKDEQSLIVFQNLIRDLYIETDSTRS